MGKRLFVESAFQNGDADHMEEVIGRGRIVNAVIRGEPEDILPVDKGRGGKSELECCRKHIEKKERSRLIDQ